MTTTVTVKARAHGAVVETDGETLEISPNSERQFHIEEGSQTFSVMQPAEAPALENPTPFEGEEVPGRTQNDELTGQGAAGKRGKTSAPSGDGQGDPPVV